MPPTRFTFPLARIVLLCAVTVSACSPSVTDRTATIPAETATTTPTATITPSQTPTLTPRNHYVRGVDYQENDEFELAIAEFDKAILIDPTFIDAYFERGRTYALQGDYTLAIEDWSKVIDLDPDNFDAHLFRAFAYDDSGDCRKAIADYDVVIELDPQFAEAYYWRGIGHAMIGETDQAISDLDTALKLGVADEEVENAEALLLDLRRLAAGELNFDGLWGGNTGQGEIFHFTVENGGIVSYGMGFRIPGCESLSPYYTLGGEPRGYVEGNAFSIDEHFAVITGVFTSSESAMGTIEINCENGLSTSWTAWKDVWPIRTPTPDDLDKIPDLEIEEGFFSPEDGSSNFDESTSVVAANGDWFLLRNLSESVIPIPSGWISISTPNGAVYAFSKEDNAEDYSIQARVGRDCGEAETSETFIADFIETLSADLNYEVLAKEIVSVDKGYLLLASETEKLTTSFTLFVISKPSKGCWYYFYAATDENDWDDFYPIVRASVENWFDLANNYLGVSLPEKLWE